MFGSVLLGRLQGSAGAQRILGMFINTLPLRLRLQELDGAGAGGADPAGADRAVGARAGLLGGGPALQWDCGLDAAVQCAVELPAQHRRGCRSPGRMRPGCACSPVAAGRTTRWCCRWMMRGRGLRWTVETDRRIDSAADVGVCAYGGAVSGAGSGGGAAARQPCRCRSCPRAERQQVIELFNATEVAYPQREADPRVVRGAGGSARPSAVAVVYEGQSLSYAELNARANQLARYLRERGSRAGSAGGDLCRAQSGDGGGVAGDLEGRRGLCAAGSELPGRAAGLHAQRCSPAGAADAGAA